MRLSSRLGLALFAALVAAPAVGQEPEFNGRKLSEWATVLKDDPTPRKRRAAVVALGQIAADNKEALPAILGVVGKALKTDAHPAVREQAAVVLGQQKVEDAGVAAVADLTESLRIEKETAVRREVAAALGRFGKVAKPAVTPLTEALKDPDTAVRAAAADALGRIGPDARKAAADLLILVKDQPRPVRQAAVFALGRVDPEEKAAPAAALVEVLKSEPDQEMRKEALFALGFLGEASTEVVQAIAATLTDKDADFRGQAVLVLAKFGPAVRSAEVELTKVLKSDAEKQVRLNAVRTLCSGYGSDAVNLIPVLTERLKDDPDFEVRVAVAEELGAMGPPAKAAIPLLRLAQRDAQIRVREAATAAVKKIEKPADKPKP
jgi:HEAT repeat protein